MIMMILDWQDVTTDQYDRVNEVMGILSDDDAPDGLIEHTAAVNEDGSLVIVDLWESPEQLQKFVGERLIPAVEQVGIPQSEPRVMPVHNTIEGAGSEGNVLILIEVEADTDVYDNMAGDMDAHADPATHPVHIHAAATDGTSVVVADLWESEEEFGRFAQEQIGPAAAKHGVEGVAPRSAQVHNRLRGRSRATT
jgi:hypothetical protein